MKFPETLGKEGVALAVKKALVLKLESDFPLSWSLDLKASRWSVGLGAVPKPHLLTDKSSATRGAHEERIRLLIRVK